MFVPPSFVIEDLSAPVASPNGIDLRYAENELRLGQVSEVYAPTDSRNRSKKFYEYDVLMFIANKNTTSSTKMVRALAMDTFGAVADTVSYTFRKTTAKNVPSLKFNKGSRVLVLCVNSDIHQSVIIGGYPNNNIVPPKEDLGHHLSFEFNGVQFNIDKDGQVTIKRRGPTNDDGTVVSDQEANGGATVLMTSDGSVSVQSGNGNHVKVDLDATNGSLNLSCTEGVIINSGQYSMVQGENLATAITSLMTAIATATTALGTAPLTGASLGGIINTALGQFQPSSFLSAKNKVD
jgi:hypothetical protein